MGSAERGRGSLASESYDGLFSLYREGGIEEAVSLEMVKDILGEEAYSSLSEHFRDKFVSEARRRLYTPDRVAQMIGASLIRSAGVKLRDSLDNSADKRTRDKLEKIKQKTAKDLERIRRDVEKAEDALSRESDILRDLDDKKARMDEITYEKIIPAVKKGSAGVGTCLGTGLAWLANVDSMVGAKLGEWMVEFAAWGGSALMNRLRKK
jgi:uncharacterized membrane-anchored protein YjiN (DUF445 family)